MTTQKNLFEGISYHIIHAESCRQYGDATTPRCFSINFQRGKGGIPECDVEREADALERRSEKEIMVAVTKKEEEAPPVDREFSEHHVVH